MKVCVSCQINDSKHFKFVDSQCEPCYLNVPVMEVEGVANRGVEVDMNLVLEDIHKLNVKKKLEKPNKHHKICTVCSADLSGTKNILYCSDCNPYNKKLHQIGNYPIFI